MTDPKHIDRRSLLTSSAGLVAAAFLGGCGDDTDGKGPASSATASADAALGGDASAASASTATASSASPSGRPSSSAGQAGDAGDSAVDASTRDSGEEGGRGDGGGDAGASEGGMADGGTLDGGSDGGTSEAGSGGTPDGGGTARCESIVETVNSHSHVLDIPQSDVEAGFDKTYVLEDGGTGHTHTLALSAYDFVDLYGGSTIEVESSTDSAHSHLCTVTCAG